MVAKQVLFEGRVQGVGFRYLTKQVAQGYEVTGWVRNLPDGRVEMQVTGEENEVETFLRAIEDSSLGHHIQDRRVTGIARMEGVRGFSIR